MDNKDLITRFAEDCFRFEAMQQEIDGLIADEVSEVLIYEYEDLANQAAEIVLKLSANGNNVGEKFYRYYVERLEYIIDYFRALLDYEETPLAEDEQNELDDEPAAETHFEGFPAGCAFPKFPDFFNEVGVLVAPTAKDDENAAVEEADSEDEQPEELDDENDPQAAESDKSGPISEEELPLPPGGEEKPTNLWLGWEKLTREERRRVKDSVALFYRLDDIAAQDDESPAAPFLSLADSPHTLLRHYIRLVTEQSILAEERELRRLLWEAIDAIPDFRDSEEFKELIEQYPTYKEKEQ